MTDLNITLLMELEEEINNAIRIGVPQHELDMLVRERDTLQRWIFDSAGTNEN